MTSDADLAQGTQSGEESQEIELVEPIQEFELVDARRNVTEREDIPPDGGKLQHMLNLAYEANFADCSKGTVGCAQFACSSSTPTLGE